MPVSLPWSVNEVSLVGLDCAVEREAAWYAQYYSKQLPQHADSAKLYSSQGVSTNLYFSSIPCSEREKDRVRGPQQYYMIITHPSLYIFFCELSLYIFLLWMVFSSLFLVCEILWCFVFACSCISWGSVSIPNLSRSSFCSASTKSACTFSFQGCLLKLNLEHDCMKMPMAKFRPCATERILHCVKPYMYSSQQKTHWNPNSLCHADLFCFMPQCCWTLDADWSEGFNSFSITVWLTK